MRRLLLSITLAVLVLSLGCSKTSGDSGLIEPTFNYDDLVDAWRGTLASWRVDNTEAGRASYTLNDIDISLILDTQTYWLQLTFFSDSLEYQYFNRGYWLWDPYVPNVMVFEMYQESGTQIFNPIRDSGNPDSTGGSGDGSGGQQTEPPDTVLLSKGDNSKMEERFISYLEYTGDQIRLYDFIEYLDLGDITLERF
jgi:hypothetical protein